MEEELIGWVASESIGALPFGPSKSGYGYGLYFTNERLIGISYKKIVSRAYRPGYLLELIAFVLLGFLLTYFAVTWLPGDRLVPLALIPVLVTMVGAMGASLFFLAYLSPRRATQRIRFEASQTISNLPSLQLDVSLEKANISQVIVEGFRISYENGRMDSVRNPIHSKSHGKKTASRTVSTVLLAEPSDQHVRQETEEAMGPCLKSRGPYVIVMRPCWIALRMSSQPSR